MPTRRAGDPVQIEAQLPSDPIAEPDEPADHSTGHHCRLWLSCGVLAGLSVILAVAPGGAEQIEYVITFDKVAVRGFIGIYDAPDVAHLEPPGEEKPSPSKPSEGSPGELPGIIGRSPRSPLEQSGRPLEQPPDARRRSVVSPVAFAPGQGANPNFVQHGFLVEAFWAVKTATPGAFFKRSHFHPPDLSTGFEAQHLGNPDELHGIYIRSLDGKPFGLKSLRYRVTRNRQILRKPLSIEGFSNFSVNVLLARWYDPRRSVKEQFQAFPVGLAMGNDSTLPCWTLHIFGFELVDQVYIASSASVDFDDIVLIRLGPAPPVTPGNQPVSGEGCPRSDQ
jgi:hypothetical protein